MAEDLQLVAQKRLLVDMLGTARAAGGTDWRVLLLDGRTARVAGAAATVADTMDAGVSLVDDVACKREPAPTLDAVYYITPDSGSAARVAADWGGAADGGTTATGRGRAKHAAATPAPPYAGAHVFFSSPPVAADLAAIRSAPRLVAALKTCADAGLDFLPLDAAAFITDAPPAPLPPLFGPAGGDGEPPGARAAVAALGRSLATVFTATGDYPAIRFAAPPPPPPGAPVTVHARQLLAQRLAAELHAALEPARAGGALPPTPTAELLIVDRGADVVAALAHDWGYEPLAADLLGVGAGGGSAAVFEFSADGGGGGRKARAARLDARADPVWADLRGAHFASASASIAARLDEFRAAHPQAGEAAGGKRGAGGGAAAPLDARALRALAAALPQYRDTLARLTTHVELASRLAAAVDSGRLVEAGRLEQALATGAASSKDLIAALSAPGPPFPTDVKLRLLLLYAATHPGRMDAPKEAQWAKLARVPPSDLAAAFAGLEAVGVPVYRRPGVTFPKPPKRKLAGGAAGLDVAGVAPLIGDWYERMASGTLDEAAFPHVVPPDDGGGGGYGGGGPASRATSRLASGVGATGRAGSVRTSHSTAGWAARAGGRGTGAAARAGRPLYIFIAGGVTRGEAREAAAAAARLARPCVVGGSGVVTGAAMVDGLKELGKLDYSGEV